MAITPPFDQLTKLPAQGVDRAQQEFNKIVDDLLDESKTVIQDSIKLPAGAKCDDPNVQKIKKSLLQIQEGIQVVQENLPQIQQVISGVKTLINTGIAIKNTIDATQLANPVTAPVFIAGVAQALQDELIANAIAAVQPLQAVPQQMLSKLETLIPPLVTAIAKLNSVCDEQTELTIPDLGDGFPEGYDFNNELPSEFYQTKNVSEFDLQQRSDAIQELISQQEDLLASLQEAPSQVYKDNGPPASNLGKIGDFYVDIQNNIPYGPKKSDTEWGGSINQPIN
jgi:hypothetical protein